MSNPQPDIKGLSKMAKAGMNANVSGLALLVALCGFLAPATAYSQLTPEPPSEIESAVSESKPQDNLAAAPQKRAGPPVFTPTGAWSAGMSQISQARGLQGVKLPCVLSNTFDNGFVIRFSGGGNQILAMAIDFRQGIFVPGKKYKALLTLGNNYIQKVEASAFSSTALIFNLRSVDGFYDRLKDAKTMALDIEGNSMSFSLKNLASSYDSLEKCYAGETAPVIPPVQSAHSAQDTPGSAKTEPSAAKSAAPPSLPVQQNVVQTAEQKPPAAANKPLSLDAPSSKDAAPKVKKGIESEIVPPKPETPVAGVPVTPKAGMVVANVPAKTTQQPRVRAWEAQAGEDLKIVLSRWAERAGYNLEWQSNRDGKVVRSMNYNGNFEDAVAQLLAESDAAAGMRGYLEQSEGTHKPLPQKNIRPEGSSGLQSAAGEQGHSLHSQWVAPAGADVQSVLAAWAERAGVRLIWNGVQSYSLKNPISMGGSFEEAVQAILDQYLAETPRPVGQLNIEPATRKRTLMIHTVRAG